MSNVLEIDCCLEGILTIAITVYQKKATETCIIRDTTLVQNTAYSSHAVSFVYYIIV